MTRLPTLAGTLGVGLLVLAWWAVRVVGTGTRVPLDTVLYFLPVYAATWERMRAGILPTWNPYHLCGVPWIGTLQGGTFYPSHVLYAVLPLHLGLAVDGVLHLVIAALGTAAFVRRLGLGVAPALLAVASFTLRGGLPSALPAPNCLEAVAWLPVGAAALVDLVRGPRPHAVALLAVATGASLLAGYPQPTVYVLYAWGTLFVALVLHERPTVAGMAACAAACVAALALGVAIAAVQLVPALEMLAVGARAAGGLTDKAMFPVFQGVTPALSVLGWRSLSGTSLAFGLVVLACAPAAPLAPGRRVLGCWALGLALLAAAWSVGRYTPLFGIYLALPGLRLFRNPARILFVVDFAVAIAAALGLAAVIGEDDASAPRAARRTRAASLLVVTGALVGLLVLVRRGWAPEAGGVAVVAAVAIGVALAALVVAGRTFRGRIGAALAVAGVLEIAGNPPGVFHLPYAAADLAAYGTQAPDLQHLVLLTGHDRVWRAGTGADPAQTLKVSTWYGLRTMNDYEPVNLRRQTDLFLYFRDGSTTARRAPWLFGGDPEAFDAPPGSSPATRRRLLDLAAVRWVVFAKGAMMSPVLRHFVEESGLVRRADTARLLVFENPAALPRAYATYRVRTAPVEADALLAEMSRDAFDPVAESFVEGPLPFVAAADAPARGHPVDFVQDDETVVELEATLARPGLVVLADSFYPGWRATVDGTPAPIVATNHLFRGVPTPAGAHRIRFVYAPASVRAGAVLSVLGLCVLAWLLRRPASWLGVGPSRRRAHAPAQ